MTNRPSQSSSAQQSIASRDIPYDIHPPIWTSLLIGTVQPADFVMQYCELSPTEARTLERVARRQLAGRSTPEPTPNARERLETIINQLEADTFAQKQQLFEHAVADKSAELQSQQTKLWAQHTRRVIIISTLTVIAVIGLFVVKLNPNLNNLTMPQSNLGFTSVLLTPITLALFFYARSLHTSLQDKEGVEVQLVRLSAASHALSLSSTLLCEVSYSRTSPYFA